MKSKFEIAVLVGGLLFKRGFYSRGASNQVSTVVLPSSVQAWKACNLHAIHGGNAQEAEALGHDASCCFTDENSRPVDLKYLASLAVLLHAVARVIEFSEVRAQIIQVLAENMWEQVFVDALYDLGKAQHVLRQLDLGRLSKNQLGGSGTSCQRTRV